MTIAGVDIWQLAFAFCVAAVVTALELITSKFSQTYKFVLNSRWFYCYVLIYGVLGAVALILLPFLIDRVEDKGGILGNLWLRAGLVGLSIKAFLHIRIFTVSPKPGQSIPVGLETIVQLFEPWMTRQIENHHFAGVTDFIRLRARKCPNVAKARRLAKANIPNTFDDHEKAALIDDIRRATTSHDVIRDYMKYVGISLTEKTFPA
jgi:hypothetical protein